jgi:hypothetical protein
MDANSELTQAQATQVVVRGVNREAKRGNEQALALVRDAITLKDHNVRKLASAAEVNGHLTVGFDSYLSYMSNAAGIAAMFDWELTKFQTWLEENPTITGLSAAYKCLREAFTEPKPAKNKGKEDKNEGDAGSDVPLVDQVLAALEHLTIEELQIVALAATEMSSVPAAA